MAGLIISGGSWPGTPVGWSRQSLLSCVQRMPPVLVGGSHWSVEVALASP